MDEQISAKTYVHHLCADTGCDLKNLLIGKNDKKETKESVLLLYLKDDDERFLKKFFSLFLTKICIQGAEEEKLGIF